MPVADKFLTRVADEPQMLAQTFLFHRMDTFLEPRPRTPSFWPGDLRGPAHMHNLIYLNLTNIQRRQKFHLRSSWIEALGVNFYMYFSLSSPLMPLLSEILCHSHPNPHQRTKLIFINAYYIHFPKFDIASAQFKPEPLRELSAASGAVHNASCRDISRQHLKPPFLEIKFKFFHLIWSCICKYLLNPSY